MDVPVVATADDRLAEDALRWCAALGSRADVVSDVTGVRRAWTGAAVVIVGSDLAPSLVGAGLARRDHVLLVDDARPGPDPWATAVGLGAVDVVSAGEEQRALEALALALDGREEACVVSVVGAVGGAGASTVVTALGQRAARRDLAPVLLDLDSLGGGLDLVLGSEHAEGARWQGLGGADGTISAASLTDVLPTVGGLSTLTFSRDEPATPPASLDAVLRAAARGFDVVVADVPRHAVAAAADVVSRSVCTVVLVPEETRAVGAARTLLSGLEELTARTTLLTVARPGGIGQAVVASALERPVLARVRHDRRLRAAVEQGHGPRRSRTVARAADRVLDALGLAVGAS